MQSSPVCTDAIVKHHVRSEAYNVNKCGLGGGIFYPMLMKTSDLDHFKPYSASHHCSLYHNIRYSGFSVKITQEHTHLMETSETVVIIIMLW